MSISINQLSFSYSKNADILHIPQWDIDKGDTVFLHGSSGSGKSTLLNLITGVIVPQSGSIQILGERLDQMKSRERDRFRAKHIGYVFQNFNLIPSLSVMDNVHLSCYFSGRYINDLERAATLLQSLQIPENCWHREAQHLSIGQQQRVAIARALVHKPEILIADEPTSSLDAGNRDAFIQLMLSMAKEHSMTVVFVSHDQSLASYFQHQVSLNQLKATAVV
ncbi:MAG: ABC transporter ATP-binding protein [Pseudomonadota bacterium]|nr:ABC transporter ATP-binding protein [Pseudomonadota bacterium]